MHSALLYFTLLCSPASSSPPPPPLPRRLRAAECEERGARRKESSRQREIAERERDGERRGGGVEEAPKNIPPDVSCCSHIRPLHLHCSIPTHTSALHAAGRLVTTEQHQHRGAPLSESCMLEKKILSFHFNLQTRSSQITANRWLLHCAQTFCLFGPKSDQIWTRAWLEDLI